MVIVYRICKLYTVNLVASMAKVKTTECFNRKSDCSIRVDGLQTFERPTWFCHHMKSAGLYLYASDAYSL